METKQVTTFRFPQEIRDELDQIQRQVMKSTWQQTVNHVILDYRRLVQELVEANQQIRALNQKLSDNDRNVREFRTAFQNMMDANDPLTTNDD